MGGVTYHLCEIIKEKKWYHYWYLLFVIPIVWWLPRGEESNEIYLRDTIACSMMVITLYCLPKLQVLLNWEKIKGLKKISYSLFVTHGLVNQLFSGYLVLYFKNNHLITNVYLVQLVTFLIVLAIDLVLAGMVYYLVEYKLYSFISQTLSKKMNQYQIDLLEEGEKVEK